MRFYKNGPIEHDILNRVICVRVVKKSVSCFQLFLSRKFRETAMVSRRKILSRSRDELHSDIYYMAENDDDDVWYNKEKLYAVRVRKLSLIQ